MIRSAILLVREQNRIPPIIVLIPDDPLLTSWSSEAIRILLFGTLENALINTEIKSGPEVTLEDMFTLLKERPLFGKRRLLWVQQSEKSSGLLEKKSLLSLLSSPSNGSLTIVLEVPERKAESLSELLPVFRAGLPKQPKARANETIDWIHIMAGRKNLRLSPESAEMIGRGFSDQFGQVSSFLDRIPSSEERGNKPVTPKELELHGLADPLESIFKIFDSWEKKDKRVFSQWERLIENGQTPLGLISIWSRQWRIYALAHFLSKGANAVSSLADQTKLPPFVAEKAVAVGRNMSAQTLRKGYSLLREADLRLKSGCDPSPALDRFFIGMWALSPGKGEKGQPIRTGR
ncbi:MAG: DNA polymerase III subunit delta [Leptospirales bacterium]